MIASLENFGSELKKKREDKNISIRDIYEKTRIDAKYLEEMEKGNFDFMPEVYVRAFIRKYADSIDFAPDEAIKIYDAARKGKSIDENLAEENISKSSNVEDEKDSAKTSFKNSSANAAPKMNTNIIIALFVFFALAVISYFIFSSDNKDEIIIEPNIEEQLNQVQSSPDNTNPRFEVKKTESIGKSQIVKPDSILLKINAVDTSWFRIKIDGKTEDEFILYPSRTKMIYAESKINLLLGNSGGVEFFLNGKRLQFAGKKGEIKNISIDANGIHLTKLNQNIKIK